MPNDRSYEVSDIAPDCGQDLKNACADAMQVQDACNVSGVVLAFARAMEAINAERERLGQGTDFVRNHPVTILFVNKLEDMVASNFRDRYSKAYANINELLK